MGQSLRSWTGLAWRTAAALCALLATGLSACSWFTFGGGGPAYGVQVTSPVPLAVQSFSVQPPSTERVGDTLTFTAQLELAQYRQADVYAGNLPEMFHLRLHDDGLPPDAAPGDGIFTGSAPWLAGYGAGKTKANLVARGEKPAGTASGHAELLLDVLP